MQAEPKRRWPRLHWATWVALILVGAAVAKCQLASHETVGYWGTETYWESQGWPVAVYYYQAHYQQRPGRNFSGEGWYNSAFVPVDALVAAAILICVAFSVERWVNGERSSALILMLVVAGMAAIIPAQRLVHRSALDPEFLSSGALPSTRIDVVLTMAAVALVAAGRKRFAIGENRFQFSLRSLFVLTAIVAVLLGTEFHRYVAEYLRAAYTTANRSEPQRCSPYDLQLLPLRLLVLFGVGCAMHEATRLVGRLVFGVIHGAVAFRPHGPP